MMLARWMILAKAICDSRDGCCSGCPMLMPGWDCLTIANPCQWDMPVIQYRVEKSMNKAARLLLPELERLHAMSGSDCGTCPVQVQRQCGDAVKIRDIDLTEMYEALQGIKAYCSATQCRDCRFVLDGRCGFNSPPMRWDQKGEWNDEAEEH